MSIKFQFKKAYKEYLFRFKYPRVKSRNESVYFYTFHKCASSLFSKHILKDLETLQHVDYANYLADKPTAYNKQLIFKEKGCIYGPIRLSASNNIVFDLLVKPTIDDSFIKNVNAIIVIRDPRDILVSSYHSFGFTHPLNPIKGKTQKQLKLRNEIQSVTIDEYVLKNFNKQVEDFESVSKIANNSKRCAILKYEDMINNYDVFIKDFKSILDISDQLSEKLFNETRPKKQVDNNSHRRSGESRRFMKDLKPETIMMLNKGLQKTLEKFGYSI